MRLLVTRPEPDAAATAARLTARGHTVHIASLLRVHLHEEPALDVTPGALVVTSRNGVRALAGWPAAERWHDLPLYAIGEATAELSRSLGFTNVHSAKGDVAALRALVQDMADPHAGPLLYPAAREPAADLAGALTMSGFAVTEVEGYHTDAAKRLDPDARALFEQGTLDGLLVYSPRTGTALKELLDAAGLTDRLGQVHILAISAAAGAPLAELQVAGCHIADRPDEAAMLALVDTLSKRL